MGHRALIDLSFSL
jgi:large subunit ribosomal protein LP1